MAGSMRFSQIMEHTFANTDWMRERKIQNMYKEVRESMEALKQADAQSKNAKEKLYMKAFVNVMERMSKDLHQVRQQYEKIDKEGLKISKCEKYAEDIRLFRQECYLLRKQLEKVRQNKRKELLRSDILDRESNALCLNIDRNQETKKSQKHMYKKLKSYLEGSERDNRTMRIQSGRHSASEDKKKKTTPHHTLAHHEQLSNSGRLKSVLKATRPKSSCTSFNNYHTNSENTDIGHHIRRNRGVKHKQTAV